MSKIKKDGASVIVLGIFVHAAQPSDIQKMVEQTKREEAQQRRTQRQLSSQQRGGHQGQLSQQLEAQKPHHHHIQQPRGSRLSK